LTNVQFADSGFYTVVVSNALGTATSDGAQVTVGFATALFILVQPSGQNVSPGGTASFSVIADGAPPLFYRWRKDGIPLAAAAATGSSLLLTNVQLSDAGGYSVVVSNVSGAITSVVAFLTVGQPGEVRLSIAVSNGLANLRWSAVSGRSYQVEYKADLPLPTWSNLLPAIVASGPSASATDVVGTRLRRFYRIEILPQANTPPSILVPPVNQTVPAGANVTFTVMADGTPPLSYQWLVNGSEIPGATSASLPLNNVQVTDTGIYEVAVGNAFGSVTSEPVFLFVTGF